MTVILEILYELGRRKSLLLYTTFLKLPITNIAHKQTNYQNHEWK